MNDFLLRRARNEASALAGVDTVLTDSSADLPDAIIFKPRPLTRPKFVGDLVVGQLLTVLPGSWAASSPLAFSYLWIVGGVALPQITVPEFELPQSAIGQFVRCIVTASAVGGRTSVELVSAVPVRPVSGVWFFDPTAAGVAILTYPSLPPSTDWVIEPTAPGARIIRYPGDL